MEVKKGCWVCGRLRGALPHYQPLSLYLVFSQLVRRGLLRCVD